MWKRWRSNQKIKIKKNEWNDFAYSGCITFCLFSSDVPVGFFLICCHFFIIFCVFFLSPVYLYDTPCLFIMYHLLVSSLDLIVGLFVICYHSVAISSMTPFYSDYVLVISLAFVSSLFSYIRLCMIYEGWS